MISCFKGKFRVTSPRGNRVIFGKTEFHKGLDLVGIDDITVYAVSGGKVRCAYQPGGAGTYVVITMDDGRRVYYMHLSSSLVRTGQVVKTGEAIGIMGATGMVTGAHTHLELRPAGTTSDSLDIAEFCQIPNKQGLYTYADPMTAYEAACKIETACGLEKQTMQYLWAYPYANDLMLKLWKAMEDHN